MPLKSVLGDASLSGGGQQAGWFVRPNMRVAVPWSSAESTWSHWPWSSKCWTALQPKWTKHGIQKSRRLEVWEKLHSPPTWCSKNNVLGIWVTTVACVLDWQDREQQRWSFLQQKYQSYTIEVLIRLRKFPSAKRSVNFSVTILLFPSFTLCMCQLSTFVYCTACVLSLCRERGLRGTDPLRNPFLRVKINPIQNYKNRPHWTPVTDGDCR